MANSNRPPIVLSKIQNKDIMQEKLKRIAVLLILLIPISSFSMVDSLITAGVGGGIFVVITILSVVAFVLSKIVEKKEKTDKKNPATLQRD